MAEQALQIANILWMQADSQGNFKIYKFIGSWSNEIYEASIF